MNVKLIVDVGAGKGYITQTLEHYYGMEVIGLEGQESRTHGASKRSIQFQKELFLNENRKLQKSKKPSKSLEQFDPKPLFNMTFFINKPPDVKHFLDLIDPIKSKILEYHKKGTESISKDELDKMGLLCLHGCGDLSPAVLELYVECPQFQSMVCVGCCYPRIKEEQDSEKCYSKSFPMSETIKTMFAQNPKINRKFLQGVLSRANETPNQFINLSQQELTNKSRLLWRSMLELILSEKFGYNNSHPALQQHPNEHTIPTTADIDYYPKEDHWTYTIRGLPTQSFESFESYCEHAIPSIRVIGKSGQWYLPHLFFGEGLYNEVTETSILNQLKALYTQHQDLDLSLILYLSLQNCLSGVCESLVMMDRYFYLEEKGNKMVNLIVPVFHQQTSPRNLAIISYKN
uniref:Methyltransferase domain-containing protein n=1 Tax=Arcella intermedia TaxID=1963864 RepID=A0A6B2L574_9EUKA